VSVLKNSRAAAMRLSTGACACACARVSLGKLKAAVENISGAGIWNDASILKLAWAA